MKKIISVILPVIIMLNVFCISGITVAAEKSGNYEYKVLEDGTAEITTYAGFDSRITIPKMIKGHTVTSIGDYAFYNTGLTSVTIPDSVTSIGSGAFYGCTGLSSITIPDSVTNIYIDAFTNTSWYNDQPNGLVYAGKVAYSIKGTCPSKVEIKDGTLVINVDAFRKRTNLTSITIPDSVTRIGDRAFVGCTNLSSITIPNSVTSIGSGAFYGCTNLKSVTIGSSVTSIGDSAFSTCTNLKDITIQSKVEYIGASAFYKCESLQNITIPSGITSIGKFAFYDCVSLQTIDIPKGVTNIGINTFTNTAYYNNAANWENDVLYIGNHLIKAKPSLSGEYRIKNGTVSIAAGAFSDCEKLTKIVFPTSIKAIGEGAFEGCSNLATACFPKGINLNLNNVFPKNTNIIYTEVEPFVVEYNANGGSGAPEKQTVSPVEATFTVPNTVLSRANHAFVGWSETPNGTAEYLPGKSYTIDRNMTLYAVWTPAETYTIRYALCGGKGEFPDQIKNKGINLKLSTTRPTHNYYTFAYWLSSNRETTYFEGDTYRADASDILYAIWKEKCPKCNGTQYSSITNCNNCKGKGTITTTYTCTGCKGTGMRTKTSTVTCTNCDGNGIYWGLGFSMTGYWGWQWLPCSKCNATGKVKKEEQVTCNTCGGDGIAESVSKCANCQGTGQIKTKCDKCEGKGNIYHYPDHYIDFDPDADPPLILGDMDGDGEVSITDATLIQRHIAEIPVYAYNEATADTDGDGSVTIMDATCIQYWLASLTCPDGIGNPIS